MSPTGPDISIVIPVWNEADKIVAEVEAAIQFFEFGKLNGEVIVSDDGSSDHTPELVASVAERKGYPVRIIRNHHLGKGNAVREGMMAAGGNIILFIDSGNCISYRDVKKGLELLRVELCDIAHASRFLPESRIVIPKGRIRRIVSYLFRKFIHFYLNLPPHLTDTQCGLKIYRKEIAHRLYGRSYTQGFMFDIEIIQQANRENFRIREFPVTWRSDPDSRLSLIRSLPGIIRELVMLKRQYNADTVIGH
jgi:dolichyl-phosphate beta-glucosyltransferase